MKPKRAVNVYWRQGRRVRILHPAFGYGGKIGVIRRVGAKTVIVRVIFSKKPGDFDEVVYPNPTENLMSFPEESEPSTSPP